MDDGGVDYELVEEKLALGQEEEDRLLYEYQDAAQRNSAIPRRKSRLRLRPYLGLFLSAVLLTSALLAFLSYSLARFQGWTASGLSDPSLDNSDDESLAIRLRPDLHRYRNPHTIEHEWTISSGIRSPDGVEKQVYLINGTPASKTLAL